jgi:hypothetical protein
VAMVLLDTPEISEETARHLTVSDVNMTVLPFVSSSAAASIRELGSDTGAGDPETAGGEVHARVIPLVSTSAAAAIRELGSDTGAAPDPEPDPDPPAGTGAGEVRASVFTLRDS